jgi:hypothetical protein
MHEHLAVGVHGGRVEDSVNGRIDLVLEEEAVPSDLPVLEGKHPGVEATTDIWRVELGVGSSDGGLELSG